MIRRSDRLLEVVRKRWAEDELETREKTDVPPEQWISSDGSSPFLVPAVVELLVDIRDAMVGGPASEVDLRELDQAIDETIAHYTLGGRAAPLVADLSRTVRRFLTSKGIGVKS